MEPGCLLNVCLPVKSSFTHRSPFSAVSWGYVERTQAKQPIPLTVKERWFFQPVCAQSLQSCLTLCDTMDYSLPGSSVRGILQAGTLEWVALIFPVQGLNLHLLCLLCCRQILYPPSHLLGEIVCKYCDKALVPSSSNTNGF